MRTSDFIDVFTKSFVYNLSGKYYGELDKGSRDRLLIHLTDQLTSQLGRQIHTKIRISTALRGKPT